MANDTGSGRVAVKGLITRSSRDALSNEVVARGSATPNRKSERLEKRTPLSHAVKMDQKRKTTAPSPLRRSDRTRNPSSSERSASNSKSSGSKKQCTEKQLVFEASSDGDDEEGVLGASSRLRPKRLTACAYLDLFVKPKRVYLSDCLDKTNGFDMSTQEDCHKKSNEVDRLTQEGDDGGGIKIDREKIDRCLKGNCLDNDNVTVNSLVLTNASTYELSGAHDSSQSDSSKEKTLQVLGSGDSVSNENLLRKCVGHDKDEKSINFRRKRTMVDMHSDASAMLVYNDNSKLIEDVHLSRICGNVVETSGSCSKRIRRISLSYVKRDWRKATNNVDEPSSKSNGEKVSARNKEGNHGGPTQRELQETQLKLRT